MDKVDKYLTEIDNEKVALDKMLTWIKDIKMRLNKAERSIKSGKVDRDVADVMHRMGNIYDEEFYEYFWS